MIEHDPEAVRAALQRVLARPEFQTEKRSGWIGRIVDAIGDWIARCIAAVAEWIQRFLGVSAEAAGHIVAVVIYIALGVLAGCLVVWLVRTVRARRGRTESGSSGDLADARALHAAELEKRAREAEARGDHALALRLYFWALVVGLGERGGLQYRESWTNRELLERGAPRPDVDRVLRPLVPELDRKTFGVGGAAADDVARMAHLFRELVGSRA